MSFVRLIFQSLQIQKRVNILKEEKYKSLQTSQGKKPKYSWRQKYRNCLIDLRVQFKKCVKRLFGFRKHSYIYKLIYKLQHDGTCENFTLKSIIGFIGGFFLTYIFFMFFVLQLNFKLSTATIMCSIFGSILTIGLAFSYKIRCVVFLLLPHFFSKRGRQALMAYAFILAITGPAKNTLHNMGILSESLACGQEQLKTAVRQIVEAVKKPFYAIKDAIKTVVKTVKVIVRKMKQILLVIKRVVLALVRVIRAAFQFLGKILNVCNKEIGTPFERCMKVFEEAITDCNAKLGPLFNWLCSIAYLVQSVCYIVKIFDFICMIVDFISDSIVGVIFRKIRIFVRHIKTMFYVKIKFSHSFHFQTTQSKSVSEVAEGIVTEVRQRSEKLLTVFDFMSCATSMFFLAIIIRVLHYRYKFLTSDRYDNKFITKNLREIDMRRAQLERETILPLNHRERALYISVNSVRLVKTEKVKLSKASVALAIISLKLSTHMMVDYALYWVLMVIRYHSKFQSKIEAPNVVGMHVEGKGFVANLLRSIVTAFQPLGIHLEIDTIPCLPDPIPPDYDRYIQIASLLLLCWILTIFEPYGLRLRHSVMCYYHPMRARQRAVWLYNHIMRSRSSFLKYARRQLRRKIIGVKGIAKITCKEYLRANIDSKWLRLCLGSDEQDACLLCGDVFRKSNITHPIRCAKPNCSGIYCEQCFADLKNLCTVCMEPIQYGDLSDVSEEKDSSEDLHFQTIRKKRKKKRKCKISKCCKGTDDDDSDNNDNFNNKEREKLLRIGDDHFETSDSDYRSDTETDTSYTYQNTKRLLIDNTDLPERKFGDLEKQKISQYASWDEVDHTGVTEIPYENALPTSPTAQDHSSRFYKKMNNHLYDFQNFIKLTPPTRSKFNEEESVSTANRYFPEKTKSNAIVGTSSGNLNTNDDNTSTDYFEQKNNDNILNVFDGNVKYGIVKESTKSCSFSYRSTTTTPDNSFSSSSSSTLSPLNVSYEVYVPRYDKFVSCTNLLDIKRKIIDCSPERDTEVIERVEELKNIQRKKRLEEILCNSRSKLTKKLSNPSLEESQLKAATFSDNISRNSNKPYRDKVKNYYKSINKPFVDTCTSRQKNNTITTFLKGLFKKIKSEKDHRDSTELETFDDTIVIRSPKSTDSFSTTQESRFISTSSSSETFLTDSNLKTTTISTESSLMGSTESYARGGADSNITAHLKTTSKTSQHQLDIDSSDSEITDLDIFFGSTGSSKKRSIKLKAQNRFEIEQTPRFLRQPAERDQDPSVNKIMPDNGKSSEVSSQRIDAIRHTCPANDDTSIRNRHRCCSCPAKIDKRFNTSMLNQNYKEPYPRELPSEYNRNRSCLNQRKHFETEHMIRRNRMSFKTEEGQRDQERLRFLPRVAEECKCSCRPSLFPLHNENQNYPESESTEDNYYCGNNNYATCKQHCTCDSFKVSSPQTTLRQAGDDQVSCCSGHSEFPELVYQHTEEYLDLVNELGDTLSLRNKHRVETTIREFEHLSRQNKNLEKPIFDDDTEDEYQRATLDVQQHHCCCGSPNRNIPNNPLCHFTKCDAEKPGIIRGTDFQPHTQRIQRLNKHKPSLCYEQSNNRWQKDHRSGKWYKLPDDSEYEEDIYPCSNTNFRASTPPPPPPPLPPPSTMYSCDNCRRFNSKSTGYRKDGYEGTSPSTRCCNCGCWRDPDY